MPPSIPAKLPRTEIIPLPNDVMALIPISNKENTPLNVSFKLFAVVSLIFKCDVSFFNPTLKEYNCLAVIGGKISLNASCIGFNILSRPSKVFFNESIIAVRPPKSFQSDKTLFRASAEVLIILLKVSLIPVKKLFASSKSPTIISQLCVHPD